MSMYVDLLSTILGHEIEAQTGEELLELALRCRFRMLHSGPPRRLAAHDALANEVAYDRALIKLCVVNGIAVAPERFAQPRAEWTRLERALVEAGVDLGAHASRPCRPA
jgi:hypothetical protein